MFKNYKRFFFQTKEKLLKQEEDFFYNELKEKDFSVKSLYENLCFFWRSTLKEIFLQEELNSLLEKEKKTSLFSKVLLESKLKEIEVQINTLQQSDSLPFVFNQILFQTPKKITGFSFSCKNLFYTEAFVHEVLIYYYDQSGELLTQKVQLVPSDFQGLFKEKIIPKQRVKFFTQSENFYFYDEVTQSKVELDYEFEEGLLKILETPSEQSFVYYVPDTTNSRFVFPEAVEVVKFELITNCPKQASVKLFLSGGVCNEGN